MHCEVFDPKENMMFRKIVMKYVRVSGTDVFVPVAWSVGASGGLDL